MSAAKEHDHIPQYVRFLTGGAATMTATSILQPLDLIKTRMQMSGVGSAVKEHRSSLHTIATIFRREGIFAFYNGLSAALLRQATYGSTRLGIYTNLMEKFKELDGSNPKFFKKCAIAVTAGAIGAFVGTPAEVSLIRMTSDGRLPVAERRNYSNVFNALYRICKEEKVFTLWRGCGPTIVRAMVVNAAQLATYSQAKQFILTLSYFNDNILCHFVSSMISGLTTTVVSLPLDIAKTRIQTMKVIDGKPEYKGSLDVIVKVLQQEGVASLWKGFTPYYLRIGPITVLTFVFLEQLNKLAKSYYN